MGCRTVIATSVATVVVCNTLGKIIQMIDENDKPKTKVEHPSYGYWLEDKQHNFTPLEEYINV